GHVEALSGLTRMDLDDQKPAAARARLVAQLARTPNDPALLALAGRTSTAMGDDKTAESYYRHILEVSPSNTDAFNQLGALYGRQNRLDEAKQEFEQVAKHDPRNAAVA